MPMVISFLVLSDFFFFFFSTFVCHPFTFNSLPTLSLILFDCHSAPFILFSNALFTPIQFLSLFALCYAFPSLWLIYILFPLFSFTFIVLHSASCSSLTQHPLFTLVFVQLPLFTLLFVCGKRKCDAVLCVRGLANIASLLPWRSKCLTECVQNAFLW